MKTGHNNFKQLPLSMFDTSSMVSESIAFLRQHEPSEGYYVGFSGGKDSIVTLELCRMAGVQHKAFYSNTRIDPPEVVRFIHKFYPDVVFLSPSMTFWEGIKKKSPPLRVRRWCCDVLKKEPGKQVDYKYRVMGIRAEESARRASRPRQDSWRGQIQLKPIFYWKEWHIWDFIESQRLPYPSLYDEGFHRIGCVICPFIMGPGPGKTRNRALSMQRWPGLWKAFEHACYQWFSSFRNPELRPNQKHATFESYYAAYLLGFEC